MKTREWVSKDKKWGGMLTTHRDGSQVLELHKERRYALLRSNVRLLRAQNDTFGDAADRG